MWMIVLTKMALWIYMKKWIDLDEGRDSIYRPRVSGWMAKMIGEVNGEGRLGLPQKRAHGLCFFKSIAL